MATFKIRVLNLLAVDTQDGESAREEQHATSENKSYLLIKSSLSTSLLVYISISTRVPAQAEKW